MTSAARIASISLVIFGVMFMNTPLLALDKQAGRDDPGSLSDEELLVLSGQSIAAGEYDTALLLVEEGLRREGERRINYLHLRYNIYNALNDDASLLGAAIDLAGFYSESPKKARDVARISLRLNDPENALEWLGRTVDRGFLDYSDLAYDRVYDPIRSTARFQKLLSVVAERIGLNEPARSITGTTLTGRQISLSELAGKVVLVDFWALYCSPCLVEINNFLEFYPQLSKLDFEILSINLDEDQTAVERFIEKKEITWPVIFSGEAWEDQNRVRYDLKNIPSTWLVDRNGILRASGLAADDLKKAIEELLQE